MKKVAFLFVMTSFFSGQVFAQLSFSPIIGGSLTNVNKSFYTNKPNPVPRYAIGGEARYKFGEKISIGLGLQLATKGFENEGEGNENFMEEACFKYFEVQQFIQYKPLKSLGILLGGSVGFLNKEEYKINGKWIDPDNSLVKNKEIAALIGVRYYYKNAFLGLNLCHSIVPITEFYTTNGSGTTLSKSNQFHQSLLLYAGYNFELKKK
jgi:hypothetical protein